MIRATTLATAFAAGFLSALAGAWYTLEIIVRLICRRGRIQ